MITRIFDTAVDPDEVDRAGELFRQHVRPAFDSFTGCRGIEMYRGVEEHSGDLVDLAVISQWDSLEAIESALATDEYALALAELRTLFRQNPIVRHFETVG
jgi:quinol monooxygenase YgiN